MSKALLIIDPQNDYFSDGAYPLWNAEPTLENIERAIATAKAQDIPIILIQHVAEAEAGPSPFFNEGTPGVEIHPRVRAAVPDARVVIKHYADAFERTELEATLRELGVAQLLLAGMMTQNCVTHTAISKAAEKYDVTVLSDACTTVDQMIHMIALHGLSTRVALTPADEALA